MLPRSPRNPLTDGTSSPSSLQAPTSSPTCGDHGHRTRPHRRRRRQITDGTSNTIAVRRVDERLGRRRAADADVGRAASRACRTTDATSRRPPTSTVDERAPADTGWGAGDGHDDWSRRGGGWTSGSEAAERPRRGAGRRSRRATHLRHAAGARRLVRRSGRSLRAALLGRYGVDRARVAGRPAVHRPARRLISCMRLVDAAQRHRSSLMRATSLGQAGILIETAHGSIVCDPWFVPAFFGSWFVFPRNDQLGDELHERDPRRRLPVRLSPARRPLRRDVAGRRGQRAPRHRRARPRIPEP